MQFLTYTGRVAGLKQLGDASVEMLVQSHRPTRLRRRIKGNGKKPIPIWFINELAVWALNNLRIGANINGIADVELDEAGTIYFVGREEIEFHMEDVKQNESP